jgi:hypothetical protein
MIVYLAHHAFGVSKMSRGKHMSMEFPIGDNVGAALEEAKRWERHGRAEREAKNKRGKAGCAFAPGTVGAARITCNTSGDTVYIVPYKNKQGKWRRVQMRLPVVGADEVKQEAQRMAHIMAGGR